MIELQCVMRGRRLNRPVCLPRQIGPKMENRDRSPEVPGGFLKVLQSFSFLFQRLKVEERLSDLVSFAKFCDGSACQLLLPVTVKP